VKQLRGGGGSYRTRTVGWGFFKKSSLKGEGKKGSPNNQKENTSQGQKLHRMFNPVAKKQLPRRKGAKCTQKGHKCVIGKMGGKKTKRTCKPSGIPTKYGNPCKMEQKKAVGGEKRGGTGPDPAKFVSATISLCSGWKPGVPKKKFSIMDETKHLSHIESPQGNWN